MVDTYSIIYMAIQSGTTPAMVKKAREQKYNRWIYNEANMIKVSHTIIALIAND